MELTWILVSLMTCLMGFRCMVRRIIIELSIGLGAPYVFDLLISNFSLTKTTVLPLILTLWNSTLMLWTMSVHWMDLLLMVFG